MDAVCVKQGIFEAHAKVCRASFADFCSKMRWVICWWVGTKTGVVEMNLDRMLYKSLLLLCIFVVWSFGSLKMLDMGLFN